MKEVQLKDAKATLSALVDKAVEGQPSVITRHGRKEAVVLGFAEWERLSNVPSFGRLLMSPPAGAGALARRKASRLRTAKL
jgi:prevent-host-death family protein